MRGVNLGCDSQVRVGRVNRGVCVWVGGGGGGRGVLADDMTQMSWCSVTGLGCYTFQVN